MKNSPVREELVAELLRAHWPLDDSDFVLVTARDRDGNTVNLAGTAPQERLRTSHTYRFFGPGWGSYKGQRQFRFSDFVEHEPHSRHSIIAYLTRIKGIGTGAAQCLCDLYGDRAIGMLRQDPDGVSAAVREKNSRLRLTPEIAREAAQILKAQAKLEDARLELIDLFEGRGFPGTTVDTCLRHWGPSAARRIRRDPFVLLTKKVSGAGFLRVDRMYLELGLPPERKKRVVYLLWHTISRDGEGSTWLTAERLQQKVADCLTHFDFPKALRIGRRAGLLVEANSEGRLRERDAREEYHFQWVSRADWAQQEQSVAEDVMRLVHGNSEKGGDDEAVQLTPDCGAVHSLSVPH